MYRVKKKGEARYEIFEVSMSTEIVVWLELEGALRRALDREEFKVCYQPMVSLETGRSSRWRRLCAENTRSAACWNKRTASRWRRRPA